MLDTLTATQLARICDGTWHNQPSHGFSGVQIDSRQMQSGDLFFALPGDHVDGHKFVSQLETAKHQAAIVSKFMPEAAAAQLVVSDPLHALQALARYIASETDATKIAITGSVGKTGTKDILAYCLSPLRKTHATKGNFNNDIGAPLTITRMPSDADCLICELGMNHAGEISLLSTMMKPDISIITKIAESHAGHFADITDIAKAKAEIFDGMTAGGIAILPADDEQLPLLMSAAKTAGITNILTFGTSQDADLRLLDQSPADDGQHIMADLCGTKVEISIGMAAPHWALSALACLGVAHCLELPLSDVADSLATMQDLAGRGAKFQAIIDTHALTVIDDAYNAGPASMLAALEGLSHIQNRKAAILSDMLELGDLAPSAHLRLAKSIEDAGITEILLIGPMMAELRSKLPSHIRVICIHDAGDAKAAAKDIAANTDTLLIKGSHGSGAHILAAYLRDFAPNMAPDAAPAGGQMLPDLLLPLVQDYPIFNLFRYITFRTGGAIMTALFISMLLGPAFIRWLKANQAEGQPIRSDGPESHILTKAGTPTMGGGLILLAFIISTLLWVPLSNAYLWPVLLIIVVFGLIGAFDDWLKLTKKSSKGLNGRAKLSLQVTAALFASLVFVQLSPDSLRYTVSVPFFKDALIYLGVFYIPFAIFVVVGASNAVNLTDGLDGLAIVPVMIVAACLALIAYLSGNINFANYLQIPYVPGTGNLAVLCGALIGAGLGFLWFNAPPARVFMGDTGSLALGGALGAIAVATRHEIVLAIAGGLFVIETVSVILQVASFKLTGKRIFLMAPLHHHFEKKGWEEPTIVIRFWIITVILALISLSTLKLR